MLTDGSHPLAESYHQPIDLVVRFTKRLGIKRLDLTTSDSDFQNLLIASRPGLRNPRAGPIFEEGFWTHDTRAGKKGRLANRSEFLPRTELG